MTMDDDEQCTDTLFSKNYWMMRIEEEGIRRLQLEPSLVQWPDGVCGAPPHSSGIRKPQ